MQREDHRRHGSVVVLPPALKDRVSVASGAR